MSDFQDVSSSRDLRDAIATDRTVTWDADASHPANVVARENAQPATHARFDLAALAGWLPRVGAVLWLDRPSRRIAPGRAVIGPRGVLLLDHPALHVLAGCASASAHTQVTSHGPREWLAFRDANGEASAKMFLLPDTDYLAWDEMAASMHLAPSVEGPARWHAHTAFLRSVCAQLGGRWRARLLAFEHRRLPWLHTLDARPPLRLSLPGIELARAIAHGEGAELMAPLHAL